MSVALPLGERLSEAVLATAEVAELAEERLRHFRPESLEIRQRVGVVVVERKGLLGLLATDIEEGQAEVEATLRFVRDPFAAAQKKSTVNEQASRQADSGSAEWLRREEIRELQELLAGERAAGPVPLMRGRWTSRWQELAERVFAARGDTGELPDRPTRSMLERASRWRTEA